MRIIHCPEWRQSLASSAVDGEASDDAEAAAVDVDAALADGEVEANLTVLKVVQDWHLEYQDGPLVVVDRWATKFQFKILLYASWHLTIWFAGMAEQRQLRFAP